jgi:hypothetical protein
MKPYAAFISHTSSEARLAICLKEWIETTFLGHIAVFVSSDKRDIRAGDKWFQEIDGALNTAKVQIVICSPNSLTRPWIHFESGCAWIRGIPVIPVCHSGITKDTLPSPLSTFQGLTLEKSFSEQFIAALANHFQIEKLPRISFTEMDSELLKAASIAQPSPDPVADATPIQDSVLLDETQINILKLLSQIDGRSYQVHQIATTLGLSISKLRYFADRLLEGGYVRCPTIVGGGRRYGLAAKGRAYLVENNLIE